MTFDVESLTVQLNKCQKQPDAETELVSTAEDRTAVSKVSAVHDALQQKMMELTQERRGVLTDRHVEVSDGCTHRRERTGTD